MSSVFPAYNAIGNHAERIFAACSRTRSDVNPPTHCVLTGNTFQINDDTDLKRLYNDLGHHLSFEGAEMICVSECRTTVFPMYFDLDMKLPIAVLSTDAIHAVLRVVIRQTMRFYPEEAHESIGECFVLDKTGDDPLNESTGLYKHGVHVHFPKLMVDVDSAFQIRIGVLNGLTSYTGSWTDVLGTNPGEEWNNIVDEAVYRTGLRMLGAPKATKCRSCPPLKEGTCSVCKGQNRGYLIDRRVYKLCMVLDTNGERDLERERASRRNMPLLLSKCTVRSFIGTAVTEGYSIYPGCPRLSPSQLADASTGKKRKLPLSSLAGGASKRSTDRRFKDPVVNPRQLEIIKKYLLHFYAGYADCRVEANRNGNKIRVNLHGDNAKYCMNKAGFHKSNNVYMDIERTGLDGKVFMKCYCPCKTSTGRPGCHLECSKMSSNPRAQKTLDRSEVNVLFAMMSTSDDPITKAQEVMFGRGKTMAELRAANDLVSDEEWLRSMGAL